MTTRTATVESVVYWTNLAGELMLAPDAKMPPFVGWMRWEANTVSEIEQVSRRMARQEWEKFRSMRVEEHLRSSAKREELKANCRLRLAKGCISKNDEMMTRQTLISLEKKDQMLYRLLTEQPDLTRGSLVIEQQEQPTGAAAWQGKRKGLADGELGEIAKVMETTK